MGESKGIGESIHMRLEALCASMQRHGVQLADLDRLRAFVNTTLAETERRLEARALRPSEGVTTDPQVPRSITQRLRRLADDDPDD